MNRVGTTRRGWRHFACLFLSYNKCCCCGARLTVFTSAEAKPELAESIESFTGVSPRPSVFPTSVWKTPSSLPTTSLSRKRHQSPQIAHPDSFIEREQCAKYLSFQASQETKSLSTHKSRQGEEKNALDNKMRAATNNTSQTAPFFEIFRRSRVVVAGVHVGDVGLHHVLY